MLNKKYFAKIKCCYPQGPSPQYWVANLGIEQGQPPTEDSGLKNSTILNIER
jgi:hypothetical protein